MNRGKNDIVSNISGQLGKLPPQAVDLEEAVLAAIMLEKDAIHEVVEVLQPEHFYKDAHQLIFQAALDLYKNHEPIDMLTITDKLRKVGKLEIVGGPYYITDLTTKLNSASNILAHMKTVVETSMKRDLIKITSEYQNNAYDDTTDVFDLLDGAESEIFKITEVVAASQYKGAVSWMTEAFKKYEEIRKKGKEITGIPSGFRTLDKFTSGWQNSDFILIAGRPSMGKTAFVLSILRNIAIDFEIPVAIFSLEMDGVQITNRLMSNDALIPGTDIKKGRIELEELVEKTGSLSRAPWYIDDSHKLTVLQLRAKARRMKHKEGVRLIIIDYLQLMDVDKEGNAKNREQEISKISRALKGLAKELNIPVIALSQLSREVEKRTDKRPLLSDLRESGSLEQDADLVMFLFRPEYYGIKEDDDGNSLKGLGEVSIAKHRSGATGRFFMRFDNQTVRWFDKEDEEQAIDPSEGQKELAKTDDDDLPF